MSDIIFQRKTVNAFELKTEGGNWLGEARHWLKINTMNGDSVTWCSDDKLKPTFTVRMIEDLAAHIAAAAINEERTRILKLLSK